MANATAPIFCELPEGIHRVLICTVGLPRSGKSTWVKELAGPTGIPVVNPDSVRLAMHSRVFIPEAENMVWAITRVMVTHFFSYGYPSVVLDETGATRWARDKWKSPHWDTAYKHIDTPLEVCLDRLTSGRSKEDLDEVEAGYYSAICRMADKFESLGDDELRYEDYERKCTSSLGTIYSKDS